MNKTFENVQELHSHIQKVLKAPKNQYNSFGKYKYRNCEDILEAVKPLLPEGATIELQDEPTLVGKWHYIKATAKLTYGNASLKENASKTCTAYAREVETKKGMDASQVTGATSSYARKYALNGLFAIDDTKDADAQENNEKVNIQKMEKHEEQLAKITDMKELKKYYKANEGDGKEFAKLVTARKKELQDLEAGLEILHEEA